MEAFDTFCVLGGIAGIAVGIYEAFTRTILWRDLAGVKKKNILKFLPYDVATYIVIGIMLAFSGLGSRFPFLEKPVCIILEIVLSIATVCANVYFSNKYLGKSNTTAPRIDYREIHK